MKIKCDSTVAHWFYLLAKRTTRKKFLEIMNHMGINNSKISLVLTIDQYHVKIEKLKEDITVLHLGDPGVKEEEDEQYISVRHIYQE